MSLFGQPQQSSGGGGGLFGGTTSQTSSAQKPTLFSLTTPQASQTLPSGGLFGSNQGASTTAPQPQQSTTSGLFGGLGRSQAQPSGGLFPGLGSSTQPQQSTSGGSSLFPSLGQPSSQPAAQPAGGSLFGGLDQSQQQGQAQQGQNAQLGKSASSSTLQAAYFDQILERGRKRNTQENGGLGDLPTLQLGLGDIARKVRNLGTGGPSPQHAKAGDSRAHYLLAASGVSTASALRDLNNFSAQAGAAMPPPSSSGIPDTDIDGFVSNLQTQTTLDMIQEGLEQSKRDFDSFLEENVQMNWDTQRRRIYEHFGLAKPSDDLDQSAGGALGASERERGAFGRSSRRGRALGQSTAAMSFGPAGLTKSVLGTSTMRGTMRGNTFTDMADKTSSSSLTNGVEDRYQRDKQEKYAEKVKELNWARNPGDCYPVLHKFSEVEQEAGIDNTESLVNSYKAIISITSEPTQTLPHSDPHAVPERKFAKSYLHENTISAESMAMRKRIIDGSRTCLERMYLQKVNDLVDKDPKVAQVGGKPSAINTIRGYIRVLDVRKELGESVNLQRLQSQTTGPDGQVESKNDDYCWVLLYFLLRCGLVDEAARYVAENAKAIRSIDRSFAKYIQAYSEKADRRLPPDMRQTITTEYLGRLKVTPEDALDPYRMACYKVIGRCELSRRVLDGIRTDEEDWIWLQFALAREVTKSEEMAGEVFGLEQIRETISDIGKRHFAQNSDNPSGFGLFFFMQILAGMFEQAVAWLYPHNHVTAVHFATALAYYGLLRVADPSATELLSYSTRQEPRLHFGLMVGYYTSDFRAAKPEAATDYLSLINLNSDLPGEAGIQQAKICWEALRELVLETREFAQLLGDLRADGAKLPGAIEQRIKLIRLKDDFVQGKRKAQEAMYETRSFIDTLIVQAAVAADDSGRTTDAVLLYHLAEEFDNVISIINRTLSEALSVELGQEHMRLEPLKPRGKEDGSQQQKGPDNSTLSLTSVDDPVILAHNFTSLYGANAISTKHIKQMNWQSCLLLQQMSQAKHLVESQLWIPALDCIQSINLLPLNAQGQISIIRSAAQNFAQVPPVVTRNIGDLMMWTILCCGKERERLRAGVFEVQHRKDTAEKLLQAAKDLMVFAGLIRFRLPPRVFEVLARAGQDVGV